MCQNCPPRKRWNPFATALILALVGSAILIAVVFATGSTFGQRCAKLYPKDTANWQACIQRLKTGGLP